MLTMRSDEAHHLQRLGEEHREGDAHADRDEEQPEQQALEGLEVAFEFVAILAVGEQHAGEEGAEGGRHAERRRAEGGADDEQQAERGERLRGSSNSLPSA